MRLVRIWVLPVLMTLVLWSASVHTQSDALMKAYNQGQALKEAGRYEQAIPFPAYP